MSLSPADCAATRWDVIVVGTGMGGATAGYELARRGRRVLFLEKGPFHHATFAPAPEGLERAIVRPASAVQVPRDQRARKATGHWPHRVQAHTNLGELNFHVPVGCVSGGSSAQYAAALERFSPLDFQPRANFPGVTDSSLPDAWPVSYAELEPYYAEAERLFRVRGTRDPVYPGSESVLLDPPELSERDRHLEKDFTSRGLHPYRLHVGCDFVSGCDGCPNGLCTRNCKRDSAWTCLIPALAEHNAMIFPDCEVVRVNASSTEVDGVVCRQGDAEWTLTADVVIVAAGAFATPVLLQKSVSTDWPAGVGNSNDLVGRNLMFHGGDFIAVSPGVPLSGEGAQKTLALNDFYEVDGQKLGTFQTLGVALDVGRIMQYLRDTAESGTAWWKWLLSPRPVWWRKLTSPFVRLGALVYFYWFNFRDASVWVSIVEDIPYHRNRVYADPDHEHDIVVDYHYTDELQQRVAAFREHLRAALGNQRLMVLSDEHKLDYPHVCGTCRFGDDPASSVLDRNNLVHGMRNLYVVDASFFPSSAGTNPSLTIAANALRVAAEIDRACSEAGAQ